MAAGLYLILNVMVAVATIVALIGLIPLLARARQLAVWSEVIGHSLGAIGMLYLLANLTPRFKQLYADFGTPIPASTKFVFAVSDWCHQYWYLAFAIAIVLVIADGILFAAWRADEKARGRARLLSGTITGLLAGGILLTVVAMGWPLFKLLEDLA